MAGLCMSCEDFMIEKLQAESEKVKPIKAKPAWPTLDSYLANLAKDDVIEKATNEPMPYLEKIHYTPPPMTVVLPATDAMVVKKPIKKAISKVKAETATLIQETPYKVWEIRRGVKARELLKWLNEQKDVKFSIKMGKENIHFKSPRDVSNFMLGFNVALDIENPEYGRPY
jgi:hypothetical protein